MARDVELIREILLRIDDSAAAVTVGSGQALDWAPLLARGYALSSIYYHVELLHEAGLIRADELVPGQWWPERLTWEGHEFVDAARDPGRWNAVRRRVGETVGTAPFSLWRNLLVLAAESELDRPQSSAATAATSYIKRRRK